MADFKWIKGNEPKEGGPYLISIKEDEGIFTTTTDFYDDLKNRWQFYNEEEIVAYAPYPSPYKTRKRRK